MSAEKPVGSLFDMPSNERAAALFYATEQAVQETIAAGLPVSYQDGRCTGLDQFIQEYPDGRQFLSLFNPKTRSFTVIRELPHA